MITVSRLARQVKTWIKLRPYARNADFFLASYPKSGRTWLRYILSTYISHVNEINVSIDFGNMFTVLPNFDLDPVRGIPAFLYVAQDKRIPKIWVTHLAYDRKLFLDKPVLFIARDPRDVIVSAYFHATRHKHSFDGDILRFIKDDTHGVSAMCSYLNGWAKALTEHRSHVVTYEALSADPEAELVAVLEFLGQPVDLIAVKAAVTASRFETMQALEIAQGIPGHTYNRYDTNSLRMRRGRTGCYGDYLDNEALAIIQEICRSSLSPPAKALVCRTQLDPRSSAVSDIRSFENWSQHSG